MTAHHDQHSPDSYLLYMGDEKLPSYIGTISKAMKQGSLLTNQYKGYSPTCYKVNPYKI